MVLAETDILINDAEQSVQSYDYENVIITF